GGRIGDPGLGCQLLLSDDETEAAEIAAALERLNRERQSIESAMVDEAVAAAEAMARSDAGVIVTASRAWHPGVVGLVAARLKERYGRPAFAVALGAEGVGTGSGRSIAGVDLGDAVRGALAGGLLDKGGGHAMAAGVTLAEAALDGFRIYLEERLGA